MVKKKEKKKSKKEEDSGGIDLDDAFGDDEDVEYATSKPTKVKKKSKNEDEDELDEDILPTAPVEEQGDTENRSSLSRKTQGGDEEFSEVEIKQSKPIAKIRKGDKIKVDGLQLEVDSHYVLIDHGSTKEMAIELFDSKTDKDYQLRYFDDRVKESIEFYVLEEIVYNRKAIKKVEW